MLAVPGHSGYLLSLAVVGQATAVPSGRATGSRRVHLDFVARAMREDHGFTVPWSSFRTRDGVEGLGENKRVDDTEEKN